MLVLTRKKNESIVINDNIRIEVLQIKGKQIRLGISAPASMKILRGELPVNENSNGQKDSGSDPHQAHAVRQIIEGHPHELPAGGITLAVHTM